MPTSPRLLSLTEFSRRYSGREDGFKHECNNGIAEKTRTSTTIKQLHIVHNIQEFRNVSAKLLPSNPATKWPPKLTNFRSVGLFATHDLALGDLEKSHPENVQNLCFEIDIRDGAMHLDYKLRPGVCKNLNATFLMREMGILG